MHRPIQAVYVDDREEDRTDYSRRLTSDELSVRPVAPSPNLDLRSMLVPLPDLFLIDYELTQLQPESKEYATYRGGTLALAIRERVKDRPVVLLTRKGLEVWRQDQRVLNALQVFDNILLKEDVDADREAVISALLVIADGFEVLRGGTQTWSELLECLGTRGDPEETQLSETGPPVILGTYSVPEAARWIERVLLAYPGVLDDALHTSVLLGIDEEALRTDDVARLLGPARYSGAFTPPDGRWWKLRAIEIATEVAQEAEVQGPIVATFREAVKAQLGVELEPSRCVHCDKSPADWVCHILRKPVHVRHSLAYFPDRRPPVMDEARVSFKAIIESNDVDDALFETASRERVRSIRREARASGATPGVSWQ
jgi:hypothetical protein